MIILKKLQADIENSFNYNNEMEFNVPDFIASRDDYYEIFEIEE